MESNILEQLKKDYPMIAAKAVEALAEYFQGMSSGEEKTEFALSEQAKNFLSVLNDDYALSAQNASLLSENEAQKAVVGQFKEALAQELTKRNVPEYFWRATLEIDDQTAQVSTSAEAVQTQYDAFCQQNNNASLNKDIRPQVGQKMGETSAAVDNYIRSLRSDSPLAGKLKG
ncbi:MAG: hypothetical protein PHD21_05915 [Flavobacteriales bacterium]|nr:hypothetical protein [Flavobacteriales bacterium]